jgi:hypothetical protein
MKNQINYAERYLALKDTTEYTRPEWHTTVVMIVLALITIAIILHK